MTTEIVEPTTSAGEPAEGSAPPLKTNAPAKPTLSRSSRDVSESLLTDFAAGGTQPAETAPTGQGSSPDGREVQSQADPEGTAESADVSEEKRPGEWPDSAKAALADVRKQKNALKERLEALEAELAKTKSTPPKPEEPKPAPKAPEWEASHPELRQIAEQEGRADRAVRTADRLLAQLDTQFDKVLEHLRTEEKLNVPDTIEVERVRDFLLDARGNAQRAMQSALARFETRRAALATEAEQLRKQTEASAEEKFPWLKQPESAEQKIADEVLAIFPGIKAHPEGKLWLARVVEGMKVERNGRPKPAPASPPKLPAAGLQPRRDADGEPNEAALLKKYQQTGDPKDKEAWLRVAIGVQSPRPKA